MKLNYVLGLALLICFVMFIFAGSAGADSEVVIGTAGFMGMIALLPLFLFLVITGTMMKKEKEEPQIAPIEEKSQDEEPDETEQSTVSQEEPMEDFIKKLREEKGQSETELVDLDTEGDMKKDR